MQQQTYEISQGKTLVQVLKEIGKSKAYQQAFDKLLIVYEPNCDASFLEEERRTILQYLPGIKVVAMTTFGPLHEKFVYQKFTRLSLLLFESSQATLFEADVHNQDICTLGAKFGSKLNAIPNLKGVLCFSSSQSFSPSNLIQEILQARPDIPIFGAQAGTQLYTKDESKIFTEKEIYDKGVALVAFSGEDLEITAQQCLGWKPLGRKHIITESDNTGCISTVDNKPIKDLYDKYLGIPFDQKFGENACAFPLIYSRGNRYIAKFPILYTEDFKLIFPSEIKVGTPVYFSYSKPEYLLKETLKGANEIAGFQPQSILLFACVNRQLFMGGEKATRELKYFSKILPSACACYGYGEILQTKDGGGVLTSSIIVAAFREGKANPSNKIKKLQDKKLTFKNSQQTLSDQLVSFLEATTEDLNDTIGQLADLAVHDQLTGLFNRRKLNEFLEYELGKRHKDGDFSMLMYDIDFFKKVNDEFGHSVGDLVLTHMSNIIRKAMRSCDVVGRWGGEEFVCILPNTRVKGALNLAERLRKEVESTPLPPLQKLTISIGVTEVLANDTYESLLDRMDGALYDAKKGGRNRCCVR